MWWKLAWRNLGRHLRRTVLTVSAIGTGLTILIMLVSYTLGFSEMMLKQISRSGTGNIQVQNPGYLKKKAVGMVIPNAGRVVSIIRSVPGVKSVSARFILSGALRSGMSNSVHVVSVVAADPKTEREYNALRDKVVRGGFMTRPGGAGDPNQPERIRSRRGVMIGAKLAKMLRVGIGSRVRLDTAGFRGASVAISLYVTGIIRTGSNVFDRDMVWIPLRAIQKATQAGDVVHKIIVIINDNARVKPMVKKISAALTAGPDRTSLRDIIVVPWWRVNPEIKQMLGMMDSWNAIMYMLMLVILSGGILTSLYMSVSERKREFGVMLALGTRPWRLFELVMLESLWIALISLVAGLILGGLGVTYMKLHGIDLSFMMGGFDFQGMFIENVYRGSARTKVFWEPAIVVFTGTLFFAIWPALKVLRMRALAGIRQGGDFN